MSEEKCLFVEGYIVIKEHKVIPKRVLKDLIGMAVLQNGRPIGKIEKAKIDDEKLHVKIILQNSPTLTENPTCGLWEVKLEEKVMKNLN
ncbi:hypothetical protein DRN58_09180 [Thermococci archaeon]|nr:MAG: hypothetical protein DRN58_09180 [Thermococci archaeon]